MGVSIDLVLLTHAWWTTRPFDTGIRFLNNRTLAASLVRLSGLRTGSETRQGSTCWYAACSNPIRFFWIMFLLFYFISEVEVYFVNEFTTSKLKYEKVANSVAGIVISPELTWEKITPPSPVYQCIWSFNDLWYHSISILASFFSEDNVLSDDPKICYIFEYQRFALAPGGGGGGTSVMEGDRDVPLDRVWFCRSSILAQGIKSA